MHVLSSWDIMVAHVVFYQNICLWLFIGQKNVLKQLWWLKTQERHAVPAFFLHFPWFSSYLQHCLKTENWLIIKHYRWVLQRRWNNWILPSRYGVLFVFLRLNITRITIFLASKSNLEIKLGAKLGTWDKTLPIYKSQLLMQTWHLGYAKMTYYKSWVTNWASGQ